MSEQTAHRYGVLQVLVGRLLAQLDKLGPMWGDQDLRAERVEVTERMAAIRPDDDAAINAAIAEWSQRLRELGG